MINRRAFLVALAAAAVAAPRRASSQRLGHVARVGLLGSSSLAAGLHIVEAFRDGLRQAGWIEGQNLALDFVYAEGRLERLPNLAAELVRRKVDVIFAPAQPAALAAKKVTSSIPIVFALTDDPVSLGLVTSFARPGGNATGLSQQYPELLAKRWQLLKEVAPRISRVALLWESAMGPAFLKPEEDAAKALGVRVEVLELRSPEDLDQAFAAAAKARADGLSLPFTPIVFAKRARIAELATKHRLPAVAPFREFAEAGGLMAYAPDLPDIYRRAAKYVDKILRGAKPADLPVEQVDKFELVINLKTAKSLRLTIPQSIMARADKVIE